MSSSFLDSVFLCLLAAGCIVLSRWLVRKSRLSKRSPPGPAQRPLIGNILDLPSENVGKEFATWSKKYNSEFYCYDCARFRTRYRRCLDHNPFQATYCGPPLSATTYLFSTKKRTQTSCWKNELQSILIDPYIRSSNCKWLSIFMSLS